MSQVLLFTPNSFRGIVTAPSGNAYKVQPKETIVADIGDQAFLLNFGFLPAAPPVTSGGGASHATVVVSPEQIATLHSVPVPTGIPAPGVGKKLAFAYGTAQYSGGVGVFSTSLTAQVVYTGDTSGILAAISIPTNGTQSADGNLVDGSGTAGFPAENVSFSVTASADIDAVLVISALAVTSGQGGDLWIVGDQFSITQGDSNSATGQVTAINPTQVSAAVTALFQGTSPNILAVVQGAKTFTVDAAAAIGLAPTVQFTVQGSTGNDGTYTVVSAVDVAATTVITVVEAIPDATADGTVFISGTITVSGNHAAAFPNGASIVIRGSTNNDDIYLVQTSIFSSGNTNIYLSVGTFINDPTADGTVNSTGAATAVEIVNPGTSYTTATGVSTTPNGSSLGENLEVDITAAAEGQGSVQIDVWYEIMDAVS